MSSRLYDRRFIHALLVWLATLWWVAAADAPPTPLPQVTWKKGENYFRVQGESALVLGRNATGTSLADFQEVFQAASAHGERLIRIHLSHGRQNKAAPGEVDEAWAAYWEQVFDLAAKHGLVVLPVFGVWADWNDGSNHEAWHTWDKNLYNHALGGLAQSPAEIFADGPVQAQWLSWLEKLTRRWAPRQNIAGWEIFSELNLVTGAKPPSAAAFAERAAKVIHAADAQARPVTVSLAGVVDWPEVFRSPAIDFVQVHPYAQFPPYRGNLDDLILTSVRDRLKQYGKPVLIGECGLDSRLPKGTLTLSERAPAGINHAIWAATVSGAANARMLWWEDGYGKYSGDDLRARYHAAAAPVAKFMAGVDFSRFHPLDVALPATLHGAALGNERVILGWFRDAQCAAPDWPLREMRGEAIAIDGGPQTKVWRVQFYDPQTGDVSSEQTVRSEYGKCAVTLPAFQGSLALKLKAAE